MSRTATDAPPDYERYKRALSGERLPAVVVDLDAVDENCERLYEPVRSAGKQLRVASKSIRCVELLRHIVERGGDAVSGVMAYSACEALELARGGFRDVLVAYPTVQRADLEALVSAAREGAQVAVVVDCAEHVDALSSAAGDAGVALPAVIEVDASLRLAADRVHIGVRRSPLFDVAAAAALAERIAATRGVRFAGVMVYEAHIAGLPDANPHAPLLDRPKRWLKRASRPRVAKLRAALVDALCARGLRPALFNGGGTGSLAWGCSEPALTELTAGSGFLDSQLFDFYADLSLTPAIFFALQVVRRPAPGWVTCHGGGYVASGEAGPDRLPAPYLPAGLQLSRLEGAGEVQTPLRLPAGTELALGDPVLMRHAKAGELAEHFNGYLFVRGDRVVQRAPTYRGLGWSFL